MLLLWCREKEMDFRAKQIRICSSYLQIQYRRKYWNQWKRQEYHKLSPVKMVLPGELSFQCKPSSPTGVPLIVANVKQTAMTRKRSEWQLALKEQLP